jgi:hypothetical protein
MNSVETCNLARATRNIRRAGIIQVLILAAAALGNAQPVRPALRVSSETVPPGGTAQVKVMLTRSPFTTAGGVRLAGTRNTVSGIGLFSCQGDAFGAAVQNAGGIDVKFVSSGAPAGQSADDPTLVLNFDVADDAATGETTLIDFSPLASGGAGVTSGRIQVGGSMSIRNVVPGGGMLPAGAVVTLQGRGFRPDTQVNLTGLPDVQLSFISPSEIQFTLPAAARLDGLRITAVNPDDSAAEYISYWRGVPQGESVEPLIARTTPLFSGKTAMAALLPSQLLTQLDPNYLLALALQNPSLVPADITLTLASGSSVRIALPPGARISREIRELFGAAARSGGAVSVKSSQPIQVLGLLGDRRAGTVLPFALAVE